MDLRATLRVNGFLTGITQMSTFLKNFQKSICIHGSSQIHQEMSSRFDTIKDLLPWIGEQQYIQMDFLQLSRNADICVIPGKLSEIHLHAWWFSNPQGKVLIIVGISCSPDLRVQRIHLYRETNLL